MKKRLIAIIAAAAIVIGAGFAASSISDIAAPPGPQKELPTVY